jgi:hypothetical protein
MSVIRRKLNCIVSSLLTFVTFLEKRIKKVSAGLSPHAKTASLLLQTTVTSLRELTYKYEDFRIANWGGREKVQQEYLKPKVKELLKLFTETGGMCIKSRLTLSKFL